MPTIERGSQCIHYRLSGAEDGEVLVLANSIGSDMRMWDKVLRRLDLRYRSLRYDIPGHGKSNISEEPLSIEHLGEDLVFLLDMLEFRRVSICGISLCGLLAMWAGVRAAEAHPVVMPMILENDFGHQPRGVQTVLPGIAVCRSPRRISAIESPCLVLAGTHDPVTPPSDGQRFKQISSTRATLNCRHRICPPGNAMRSAPRPSILF